MIDPMTAMYAATEAVDSGKVAEIELEWVKETDGEDMAERFTITARREVKHFQPIGLEDETEPEEIGLDVVVLEPEGCSVNECEEVDTRTYVISAVDYRDMKIDLRLCKEHGKATIGHARWIFVCKYRETTEEP